MNDRSRSALTSAVLMVCSCLGLSLTARSAPDAGPAGAGVECVARIKGIHAPPKRLAPVHRVRGKRDRDDDRARGKRDRDDDERERAGRTAGLGFKALCPKGQVPLVRAIHAATDHVVQKGNPLLAPDTAREYLQLNDSQRAEFTRRHVRTFDEVYRGKSGPTGAEGNPPPGPPPACDGIFNFGTCYYYGSAAFTTSADGAGMTESIERPTYVNVGGSGHSLNELSVQGGEGNGNIIELGWLVSSEQYGNVNPHLFVFHWKNWVQTCYDGCGWVQWSNTYHPGIDLGSAIGKKVYIGYVYYQGNWWAWFDNQWLGYFPGTEWNGAYTKSSLIQWFGEVASQNGIPPQTGMGDDQLPASPTAASMSTLCDVDAAAWVCWYRDKQSLNRTVPKYYDISRTGFGATRYGGPGQ